MIEARVIVKGLVCLVICGSVLAGGGCRFPWPPLSGENTAPPSPQLIKQYRQAVNAYQVKSYDVAAKRFKSIHESAHNGEMARTALFGLACSRLMAAQTPKQYHEAIALWESWVKKVPNDFEKENPLLLAPIVREKMLFSNIPLTADGKGDIEASPKVSQWLVINAAAEVKRLRGVIETTEQSTQKLKENDTLLRKEITKLKQKIKALEAIDQKIQKKKSAIPSADSTVPR